MPLSLAQKSCPRAIYLQEANAQCPHKNPGISVSGGSAILPKPFDEGGVKYNIKRPS